MTQQMPLPLTISCSSKSRLVLPSWFLPFWYLLTQVVPDKFQKSTKKIVCVIRYRPHTEACRSTEDQRYIWDPASISDLPSISSFTVSVSASAEACYSGTKLQFGVYTWCWWMISPNIQYSLAHPGSSLPAQHAMWCVAVSSLPYSF